MARRRRRPTEVEPGARSAPPPGKKCASVPGIVGNARTKEKREPGGSRWKARSPRGENGHVEARLLDVDGARLRIGDLRHGDGEHAVLERRGSAFGLDRAGKGERAREAAEGALDAMERLALGLL